MRMFEKLPRFVYIKGKRYRVNADFRIFIKFEIECQDEEREDAYYEILANFYPDFFEILNKGLIKEAVKQFIWFYTCGKNEMKQKKSVSAKKNIGKVYDYKIDADLIWGAFYERGVDLTTDYVHWWKFKALFNTLPENCTFKKVVGYRCYDGDDKNMLELKKLYELPKSKMEISEDERKDKIFDKLQNLAKQNKQKE